MTTNVEVARSIKVDMVLMVLKDEIEVVMLSGVMTRECYDWIKRVNVVAMLVW